MKELLSSNDLVLLSAVKHALESEGIPFFEFDSFTSAVEGSIGAIPRRLMVAEDDYQQAQRVGRNVVLTIKG